MKVTDKNFLRQLRQKNPQAIEYISAKFNMQPFEKSGMCSIGKCGAPLFFFCKKDYNIDIKIQISIYS